MADFLTTVARHHKEWVGVVRGWGEEDYCEDLVQEMYIRLWKIKNPERIIKDGQVNKSYVWFTLRSVFIDYKRSCLLIEKIRIGDRFDIEADENTNEEYYFNEIVNRIEEEKETWHWYDKMLFDLYIKTDMSMQDLADETNISKASIFNTIRKCKLKLTEVVGEDIQDFFNGDYEKI